MNFRMHIYGPSHLHGPQPLQGPHWNRAASPASASRPADQVDISPAAEAALHATEADGFRADLVARVRSQIAAGTYDSPAKTAIAVERLFDAIG